MYNPLVGLLLLGGAFTGGVMLVLWLIQLRTANAGIVDIGWAATLGGLASLYAYLGTGYPPRRALLAVLAGLWSFRLALHLFLRVSQEAEDGRYHSLRVKWGGSANRNMFFVFEAQAVLNVFLSIPFLIVALDAREGLGAREAAGVLLWAAAIAGEALADRQLAGFRAGAANKGRTCRAGLWRYSRHPNYFFEWLHWWTYVILAAGAPGWPWTLLGPALMALFLLKVTGIPATEAHAAASRPDYRDYQRTTSAFLPWFPKEGRA